MLLVKKDQILYTACTEFGVLNDRLVKIYHAFPLVRDYIQEIVQSYFDIISVADLRNAYTLALNSQQYCGITPFYGSPTDYYLRLCMCLGVSSII